jgi:acetyl-CoA carboxylase carboxyltransferase component
MTILQDSQSLKRIEILLDKDSFIELDVCEGVRTGKGTVDGRPVYIYAQDFSVSGGTLSERAAAIICDVMDQAIDDRMPIISLNESGGARIQEGVKSLAGFGEIFKRNVLASGVIPQISGIFGPCAGGAVYSPALTDFTIMIKDTSYMFLTGPAVVKTITGEEVTKEELGGATVHATKSGVAGFVAKNNEEALCIIRKILSFLPSNNQETAPVNIMDDLPDREETLLNTIVPNNQAKSYDMLEIIHAIVDKGDFFEVHSGWAKNIIVGFARMNGQSVGVVANQPKILAGALDINASRKAARFVRFCDAFNIPVITLVDVPGFLCGTQQEYGGVITHGAKLIYAYAEASVPKVTVTVRKSFGGAHITMGCKQLRGDINYAWPSAKIAVMGAESAVKVLRQDISAEEYDNLYCNPYIAEQHGSIDEIIEPCSTRAHIISALETLSEKNTAMPWKKHDNLPL